MADFDSPFPESPRTKFSPNPIVMAIAQVQFPAILTIGGSAPIAFQEQIRDRFPIYRERQGITIQLGQPSLAPATQISTRVHDFATVDGSLVLSLGQDFLSIQTTQYERWEIFRQHLEVAMDSLVAIYRPPFLSRVGLRYQDLIEKSRFGLEGIEWRDLLNPSLTAELADEKIAPCVLERFSNINLKLNELDERLTINHGLVTNTSNEQCYLIDADFFTTLSTKPDLALQSFDSLKRHSGRFFRWAISKDLSRAMAPELIE